ncbi:hypothetical protein VTP01DRAFT_7616 [Rhizomucor pusillus]|uniref:uncharacterized protein n=1 Tax=Rhizomucor pusillus TaxID=4840 RepID=UPI003742EE30
MSIQVFYENGQGNAVNGYGRPEPMDYGVDEEQYALETRSSYTQYLRNLPCESIHGSDTMQTEVAKKAVDILMREASVKRAASAAAKRLGIHVRTAQGWAKQYEVNPDSIFAKCKKNGRPHILGEEHKKVILEYVDENPSVILEQFMEQLFQRFKGLKVSKRTVYNFVRTQCNLSLKKARFQPVDRNSEAKIQERLDWVRKWDMTDIDLEEIAVFHSGYSAKNKSKDDHNLGCNLYIRFLKATMDEMDKYEQMKGHYLVMNNAPIHKADDISRYIESRKYRVVKSKFKRNRFLASETLMTRISEASNSLRLSDFEGFVSHSYRCLDNSRNGEQL